MTAISKIEMETMDLQRDIDNLYVHLNRMRQTGEKMRTEVIALNAMWEGEAKTAFTAQFEADYEKLQFMVKIIETFIKDLEFARDNYNSCENNVATIINSIRV